MGLKGQSPVVDRSLAFITLLLTSWDKVKCFWTSNALSLSYLHEWKIHSMVYFSLLICWKNSLFKEISVLLIHFRHIAFTKQALGHEFYLTAPQNENKLSVVQLRLLERIYFWSLVECCKNNLCEHQSIFIFGVVFC